MKCPESIEELAELERLIPLCKVTLYEQYEAKKKKDPDKSDRQVSREIAEELGRSSDTIRTAIDREKSSRKLASLTPPLDLSQEEKRAIEKHARIIRQEKRAEAEAYLQAKNEELKQNICPLPEGKYSVIVVDPPWPIQKIERDVRPNQVKFLDYPTMQIEEIAAIEIPSAKDCHLFLWTTQKFLPISFQLFDTWGFRYICCFTWHKAGGFQPIGLPQYNSEFVLYGRIGIPRFIDTKAFYTCFNGSRKEHSAKPVEFYEMICRVTQGPRLDMFNRRTIDGFDTWGFEAGND